MSDLDKFLKNEPLNPRMAKLMKGEEDEEAADPEQAPVRAGRDTRELDDDDREHLRRLTLEPGWPILLRLLDRSIERLKTAAEQSSLDNPLGNRDAVAQGWAYVSMMKNARASVESMAKNEVRKLEDKQK
jgi:hypothetical protein